MANEGSKSRFSTAEGTMSGIRERAVGGYQRVEDVVGQNPASAVMVSFGVGLGLGLLIGMGLSSGSQSESRRSDYGDLAGRLGQQLLDSVSRLLPESLANLRKS
jgi:hypothetical protein